MNRKSTSAALITVAFGLAAITGCESSAPPCPEGTEPGRLVVGLCCDQSTCCSPDDPECAVGADPASAISAPELAADANFMSVGEYELFGLDVTELVEESSEVMIDPAVNSRPATLGNMSSQ